MSSRQDLSYVHVTRLYNEPFDVFKLVEETQSELHAALVGLGRQTMIVDDSYHSAYLLRSLNMILIRIYHWYSGGVHDADRVC